VAGTSGKSTVSGMLAYLMSRLGLKPNFIGGGRVKQFQNDSNPGNSHYRDSRTPCDRGVWNPTEPLSLINRSIRSFSTWNLIITPVDKTAAMFDALMDNTQNLIVINADDLNLSSLLPRG